MLRLRSHHDGAWCCYMPLMCGIGSILLTFEGNRKKVVGVANTPRIGLFRLDHTSDLLGWWGFFKKMMCFQGAVESEQSGPRRALRLAPGGFPYAAAPPARQLVQLVKK